jgi:hypothetical protein
VREPTPCAFPPCPRQGVETLSLVVSGTESVLVACPRHADWLRAYVQEDAEVVLDEELFLEGQPPGA